MTRPIYQTPDNLIDEQQLAHFIEYTCDCKLIKMPIRFHIDFVVEKKGKIVAFCEYKTRNYSMETLDNWGGVILSIGKYAAAKQLYECSGFPFVFIISTLDGIWYTKFDEFTKQQVQFKGRNDRKDWQDKEPCIMLKANVWTKIFPKKD